jgi:hypothetical protein
VRDAGFPAHAIRYCLGAGKVDLDQIDHVVFFEAPSDRGERVAFLRDVSARSQKSTRICSRFLVGFANLASWPSDMHRGQNAR